jgi:hypothetical protein
VNCLAGLVPAGADHATLYQTFVDNLRFAARELKSHGLTLVVEPLNTRDVPGFFLQTSRQAVAIIEEVGADNLALQFDVYHAHIMEAKSSAPSSEICPTSPTYRWPTIRGATSRGPAPSILPRSSHALARELPELDRVRVRAVEHDRGRPRVVESR